MTKLTWSYFMFLLMNADGTANILLRFTSVNAEEY